LRGKTATIAAGLSGLFLSPAVAATPRQQQTTEQGCTEIGCTSGISAQVSDVHGDRRAAYVTLCMNSDCHRLTTKTDVVTVLEPSVSTPERVRVRLRVLDKHHHLLKQATRLATLTRTQPNGPCCPPTCFSAAFRYDARRNFLRQVK